MPLTPAQLDALFTYHPPTDEQKPKYKAITDKEKALFAYFGAKPWDEYTHDEVNAQLREFAEIINDLCPESVDKTAAIRCVRIARNALNEALVLLKNATPTNKVYTETQVNWNIEIASVEIRKARWQANSSIALDGKL